MLSSGTTSLDRIAAEAAEWFTASRTGELSPAERQRFAQWLEASPLHVQEYLGVAEAWGTIRSADAWPSAAAADLIAAARNTNNVVTLSTATRVKAEPVARDWHRLATVAAIVFMAAAAAMVSIVSLMATFNGQTYATGRGEQRSIVLEDGSVVQLNAMSSMVVHFNDEQRRIKLDDGEAFFRVSHDATRPFDVVTPVATVRAVGTEFNVYSRNEKLAVAVVDGRVQVAALHQAKDGRGQVAARDGSPAAATAVAISLGASESAEMHARGPLVRSGHHSTAAATAWLQRRLVFENERLDDVIAEFNHYTPRQMRVTNPGLSSLRISGTFATDDPETLITYLEQVQNVKAMQRGDGVTYFQPGEDPGQTPR